MTTAGTWYPPSAGTGGFMLDAQLFTNPPFHPMPKTTSDPLQRRAGGGAMSTKERPILFSGPMVRAILEGRKTQARIILKIQPHPEAELRAMIPRPNAVGSCVSFAHVDDRGIHSHSLTLYCPYGMPGNRLWVREAWAVQHEYDACAPSEIGASARWHYAATEDLGGLRKRPSIFLPRRGSRILLEITVVRVERLQEISEADAIAEGATMKPSCYGFRHADPGWSMDWSRVGELSRFATGSASRQKSRLTEGDISLGTARLAFANFFNLIHGADSWDANPWVWVVEFKRVEQEP